ncbi:MAG: hypothetical protein QM706_03310 [Nitrospira sp.]
MISKPFDILLNILLPLLAGTLLYCLPAAVQPSIPFHNHLADGLWAYAFLSSILIVWQRIPNRFWIFAVFTSAVLFETLQWLQFFPGTGDIYDVFTYFLFFIIALLINTFFRTSIKPIL